MPPRVCLNCNLSEQDKALITNRYHGNEISICPHFLPVLIHKPASLAKKLPGAKSFGPPAAHHRGLASG